MRFTYLGTAASEGVPGVFCNCDICNAVRRTGGKNVRGRSQAMINDDLLIDLGEDSFYGALRAGVRLGDVGFLCVTHPHKDHFYPQLLNVRGDCFAHGMKYDTLQIFAPPSVLQRYKQLQKIDAASAVVADRLIFRTLKPFETAMAGAYRVTALPSVHMTDDRAYLYLISDGSKTVFYGNDSPRYGEELFAYMKAERIKVDLVSMDCTLGQIETTRPHGRHMNITDNIAMKNRFLEDGIAHAQTAFVATHFSHNGYVMYDNLSNRLGMEGIAVAYDTLPIEL